jgi:hypothetical protein
MFNRVLVISAFAIAAIAAACGGGAPQVSPGGPGVTLPPIGVPSIPPIGVPSVQPDTDLESLFPDTIAGQPLQVTSARGAGVVQAFGGEDPAELQNFVSGLGASMDQVSAAFSFAFFPGATAGDITGLTLVALQVQGVPASSTLAGLIELTRQDIENAQVGPATVGGKQVTAITNPEDADENVYLYAAGDVVFLGGGTQSHVEEAFAQLP